MANIASAKKQARKSIRQRATNQARKSAMKSSVKKVLDALAAKDIQGARKLLKEAEARIARAASKGLIHRNSAARNVGRLATRIALAEKA
jgi:small subunit ribosomal protein S20